VFGSDEGERPADERVRDRVVVAVEADVRRLAGADGAEEVAAERVLGERQQARLLLGEGVGHPLLPAVGHRPRMRDLGDPARQLRVEIGHRAERAGGEDQILLTAPVDTSTVYETPCDHGSGYFEKRARFTSLSHSGFGCRA
jgi:hypothetical protein